MYCHTQYACCKACSRPDLQKGPTPLLMAAYHGYTDVVRILLKAGANIHVSDKVCGTSVTRDERK